MDNLTRLEKIVNGVCPECGKDTLNERSFCGWAYYPETRKKEWYCYNTKNKSEFDDIKTIKTLIQAIKVFQQDLKVYMSENNIKCFEKVDKVLEGT